MPYVYDVGGKKVVYWQWERVAVDKLHEIIKKEFPGMFPDYLDELELFVSVGTIALAKKGVFPRQPNFFRSVMTSANGASKNLRYGSTASR